MQDFNMIPQELVEHIISYVPEYGHRVSRDLHKRSLSIQEVSAYCDFYRYCVRMHRSPFNACITILTSNTYEDIKNAALKYLEKNRRRFLCEYLKHVGWIPSNILSDLGFANVDHWTKISLYYNDNRTTIIYKDIEYCIKVNGLYALMILLDNGFMSKKEFDAECALIEDLDVVLEIILSVYEHVHHIFNAAIRHFPKHMSTVISRMECDQATVDHIVHEKYYSGSDNIEYIRHKLCPQKMGIDADRNILRRIRDRLMSGIEYHNCRDDIYQHDYHALVSMIESMADEE